MPLYKWLEHASKQPRISLSNVWFCETRYSPTLPPLYQRSQILASYQGHVFESLTILLSLWCWQGLPGLVASPDVSGYMSASAYPGEIWTGSFEDLMQEETQKRAKLLCHLDATDLRFGLPGKCVSLNCEERFMQFCASVAGCHFGVKSETAAKTFIEHPELWVFSFSLLNVQFSWNFATAPAMVSSQKPLLHPPP